MNQKIQLAIVFAAKGIGAALSVLTVALISRFYGLEVLGLYSLALTIANVGALVSSWGLGTSYLMDYQVGPNGDSGRPLAMIVISLLSCLAVFPLMLVVAKRFNLEEISPIVALFAVLSIFSVKTSFLLAKKKQILNSLLDEIVRPAVPLICVIVGYLFLSATDKENNLSVSLLASYLLLAVAVGLALKFSLLSNAWSISNSILYVRDRWRFLVKNGAAVTGSLVLVLLVAQVDRFLVRDLAGAEILGLYAIAQTATNILTYVGQSIILVATPEIVRCVKLGRFEEIGEICKKYSLFLLIVSGGGIFGALLLGKYYFSLFGVKPEFMEQGVLALVILMVGQGLAAFFGFGITVSTYVARRKFLLGSQILAVVVVIVLCVALVPQWGVVGAAVATSIGSVLVKALLWYRHRCNGLRVGIV